MEERELEMLLEPIAPPIRFDEQPQATEAWKPSRQESLREYEVKIRFLSIGCIISVGCKEIPFTTIKEGMKALNDYVSNPNELRETWYKIFQEEEL